MTHREPAWSPWTAYRDAQAAVLRHRAERPDDAGALIPLLAAAIETRRGLDDRDRESASLSAAENPWKGATR